MQVQPVLFHAFSRPRPTAGSASPRPQDSAPDEAPRPEVSSPRLRPGASAPEGALGGLPGAIAALEALEVRGASFQRRRLVDDLGWRPATPRQAAQALLNRDPNDLQVRMPEETWQPLRDPRDLSILNAFQEKTLHTLPQAQLALNLEQLGRSGRVFTQDGQPVGTWGAYSRLCVGLPVQTGETRLESSQDVAMLGYLEGLSGLETLEHPALADALRTFHAEGYLRDPISLYRERPAELALSWHGTPLGSWRQGDPEELCKQLREKRLEHAREQVRPHIGPEHLEAAALGYDGLPEQHHADYLGWLGRLRSPEAAAHLSRQPGEQQQALRDWLETATRGPVGEQTWAEKDGVWSDSPDGPYLNNQNSSLRLPPVDLRHTEDGVFRFRCQYALESNSDHVLLEASSDAKSWSTLKSFTGKSAWTDHQVSLAAYRGEAVHLRFRLKTDGSQTQEGFSVSGMAVQARPAYEDAPRTLWPCDPDALVREVASSPERWESLRKLVDTAGLAEGLRLWRGGGDPDRLLSLYPEVGTQAALALAREGGEVATFEAARKLTAAPELEAVLRTHAELSRLPEESQERVARLVERTCTAWQAEGGWHSPADGCWSDSPGLYKSNQNASLTTPPLDLRHFHSPVATFRARHQLENRSDWVQFEASRDGQTWELLKSFTGQSDWAEHRVELSGYGQAPLWLRFRLQSDSSQTQEGLDFADFRLLATPTHGEEPELVFSDQASAWRPTLDRVLEESRGDRLERLERLSEKLPTAQALKLLDLETPAEALSEAALRVGAPAARALADRLQDVPRFEVGRELARQLQQPENLPELVETSRHALVQEVPNLLGWQPDGWVRDGAGRWSSNRASRYLPSSKTSLSTPVVNLAGQEGAKLRFEAWWDLETNSDWVRLEARPEGGEWQLLKRYTGQAGDWSKEEIDLSDFGEARLELRWRLTSDSSNQGAGFRLRDARVEDDGQMFFSDRPEDLAPLHQELARRLDKPLTELDLREGLCAALAVSHPGQMRLVEGQGLKAALSQWEEIAHLEGPALETEVTLRNQAARFRLFGAETSRVAEALRGAELDPAGNEALEKLRSTLSLAGWTPTGDWGRLARGWSDSPQKPYRPNQNATLESPTFRVPPGGVLEFQATWQLEIGNDAVVLEAGGKQLARFTGTGSGRQRLDLGPLSGQDVKLRFLLRSDRSGEYAGLDFSDLCVRDAEGQVVYQDDLGRRAADALLDLATDPEIAPEARSRALQVLSQAPPAVASRVLTHLGDRPDLSTQSALALIARLPGLVLGADLDSLLQQGSAVAEQDQAVLVGGVRVKKR